ncbi:RNA-binding (RRM/RBD/RNP motif) family protein [Forsythia ovata]|uniref:RNA-binding (RRM/RBD/RNP motif) family protein n=1 Tax=Forsythia ovata TaxID=205694 RepID=A0ABD1WYM0_9LAMI
MGTKAKNKAMMKNLKNASAKFSASKDEAHDFLLAIGGWSSLPKTNERENKATVLYIGRIPHGFYENEMQGFFKQSGTIKGLRIAMNTKTAKSKHFGFIEFESPEERTLEQHKKLVEGIIKRDQKRRKRIEAAGIDYKCPEIFIPFILFYQMPDYLLQKFA